MAKIEKKDTKKGMFLKSLKIICTSDQDLELFDAFEDLLTFFITTSGSGGKFSTFLFDFGIELRIFGSTDFERCGMSCFDSKNENNLKT